MFLPDGLHWRLQASSPHGRAILICSAAVIEPGYCSTMLNPMAALLFVNTSCTVGITTTTTTTTTTIATATTTAL